MSRVRLMILTGCYLALVCSGAVISDDEPSVEDDDKKGIIEVKPHQEGSTHRPLLALPSFEIPLPQISFPQITLPQLHLPLPQLPIFTHLPHLPLKKETVTATRTVFIETTKKVTQHPICVTAYGPKPPCIDSHHHALRELENNLDEMYIEDKQPTIEPTRVVDLPSLRSTAKVEGAEESLVENDEAEVAKRNARYLVPHPDLRAETAHQDSERVVEGLLKNTHYITKTLYVTKVEKTIDHKVTATLVAKNCIPTEPRLPQCGPLHPVHGGSHVEWKDTTESQRK